MRVVVRVNSLILRRGEGGEGGEGSFMGLRNYYHSY